jgi:hypothetical protein
MRSFLTDLRFGLRVLRKSIAALKRDPAAWESFQRFPKWYQHVRVGWLDASRARPETFESRLRYFLKMTAQNKRYGMLKLDSRLER